MFPEFDVLFLPSSQLQEWRSDAFRSREIVLNGLLRNDLLFGRTFQGRELISCDSKLGAALDAAVATGKRLLIYAPTFRSRSRPDVGHQIPFDFEQMDAFLRHTNSKLIIKLHPHMIDCLNLSPYPNISEYDRALDIYPYLSLFSIMITDVSSFATDFALMGKPIVRYVPDEEKLLGGGGIRSEAASELPGQVCRTFEELMDALIHIDATRSFEPASIFHDFHDDKSCNRFVSVVKRMIAQ